MAHQGERVAHADAPPAGRADRGVDHRQPKRAARVMGRAAPDPGRPGGPEDVGCRLDRDAPRSQPAAGRPRARRRRGLLARRRARALRCARVVFLHALHRALCARTRRDPRDSAGATVGGTAGARVEPAPVSTTGIMRRNGKAVIGAVLALTSLPVLLVLVEAVRFRVANRPNGSFMSSGQKREYLLYVPRSYDRSKRTALVISLHGAGMWGAAQKETSQWNRVADAHGFIVVYPSGAGDDGLRVWHEDRGPAPMRDVRFLSELIDTLRAAYNIDTTRVYANGLSNGGGMSFVLSCTLSDRIAAVGMVGAAHLLPFSWCTDHRPGPLIRLFRTREVSRGSLPTGFRASLPSRRIGLEETGAERTRSIPWSRRTSRAANTRTAQTTQRWCSIRLKEEATPGPVASRYRNGSSGPPATALTRRARCGRSFASIRFERCRPRRGPSIPGRNGPPNDPQLCNESGRRDLNPRPPEPHAVRYSWELRQRVATTRCSGHRCCDSDPEDRPEIVAESQRNSQRS